MAQVNLFEVATKNKYRFPFKGSISVEDLWDLKVEDLDSIFKTLNSKVSKVKEESLLVTKTKDDEVLENQIAIVKYIFAEKVKEANERQKAKERKEKKQKIMAIMASKENEALENKSMEELEAMLKDLD